MNSTLSLSNESPIVLKVSMMLLAILLFNNTSYCQDLKDARMVGVVSFSTNNYQDSVAAKNVYAAVSRILVQTKRFTVLEIDKWNNTQTEIDRQKSAAFIEREIVEEGKSLGAQVLILGFVKNAEIYEDAGKYAARVDFELKYIDVETGKSIAAEAFTGDSEGLANMSAKGQKALSKMIAPLWYTKSKWKTVSLTSAALGALSETGKNTINGKIIDAIEESADRVNTWIRNTFGFDLLVLKLLEVDKKKGAQYILIEGGEDVGLKKGTKLKVILSEQISTSRGTIQNNAPVADIEVVELRSYTSKCKVIKGGRQIVKEEQNENLRIIFE